MLFEHKPINHDPNTLLVIDNAVILVIFTIVYCEVQQEVNYTRQLQAARCDSCNIKQFVVCLQCNRVRRFVMLL